MCQPYIYEILSFRLVASLLICCIHTPAAHTSHPRPNTLTIITQNELFSLSKEAETRLGVKLHVSKIQEDRFHRRGAHSRVTSQNPGIRCKAWYPLMCTATTAEVGIAVAFAAEIYLKLLKQLSSILARKDFVITIKEYLLLM
jgi:hypothetical protein